jgi:NAD(P)-dependent dehydrogenase (short-subunit alcohol dehydrogenase family)
MEEASLRSSSKFGAVPQGALRGGRPVNAAIVALAKALSDRGIADGVQVNSVLPGPVMTSRRRSYLQHWAPPHNMTVEEATANFPKEAGIARYGEPIGDRGADGLPGLDRRALDDRFDASNGWRRGEVGLNSAVNVCEDRS